MGKFLKSSKYPMRGKTAIICGGTKGIGKATAMEFFSLGGNVCIVAREREGLRKTSLEINSKRLLKYQFLETIACDTTEKHILEPHLLNFIRRFGVPDYLINVVGYAHPQYIEKLSLEDFKKNMDVNYYGQLIPTLILLPHFIRVKKGHIAFVSSIMGFMGIMGYSTYAPTKFALVGLAEVLRNELKPKNINISVLFPPDTQTPGLEQENKTKPFETAKMSGTAKLHSAEIVAHVFLNGILKNKFIILVGEGRWIWWLFRIAPGLVRRIIDSDYKKARRTLENREK